ncbi:MAG: hypothetical protein EXS05_18235 [Planctomycetaceae bacterium]|nr:hypothetical protein [Planctomycetaceae bacterium]
MLLRRRTLGWTLAGCLACAGMMLSASRASADEPLSIAPAVYRTGDVGNEGEEVQSGPSVQFVHWRGGYGWGGGYRGYGYGYGGYRPYVGAYYGPSVGFNRPYPVYAAPVYAAPVYAAPVYAAPVYAQPVYGYGYPVYGYSAYRYRGCW